MEKFEIQGGNGYYSCDSGVVTFDIQGAAMRESIAEKEFRNLYARYLNENMTMQLQGFQVPVGGEGHNLYPQEVYNALSDNKLLPEILQKQVEFLFGKGPCLYQNIIDGEGKNTRQIRVPVVAPEIEAWLESWESAGHEP